MSDLKQAILRVANSNPEFAKALKAELSKQAGKPASDGFSYVVSYLNPQASTNNTGPWVTGVRRPGTEGFAVKVRKNVYDATVRQIRRSGVHKTQGNSEGEKMMYDRFSALPGAVKYNPNSRKGPWD